MHVCQMIRLMCCSIYLNCSSAIRNDASGLTTSFGLGYQIVLVITNAFFLVSFTSFSSLAFSEYLQLAYDKLSGTAFCAHCMGVVQMDIAVNFFTGVASDIDAPVDYRLSAMWYAQWARPVLELACCLVQGHACLRTVATLHPSQSLCIALCLAEGMLHSEPPP